jgi:protein TonB
MDPLYWLLKNRYGSLELSRQVGPNMLRGLAGSVFLHALVISTFIVMALIHAGDHATVGKMQQGPIIVMPKLPPMSAPPVRPELSKPSVPNPASKPVPVPAEPPNGEEPTPTPGPPGVPGPVASPGTGTGVPPVEIPPGGIVGTGDEQIPDPTIFTPFEFPPAALDINPSPAYPEMARISGMSGKVVLNVYVDKHGDVRKWELLNEDPRGLGFADEVLKVIPKWKFTPAIQQKSPVGVWVSIPFAFSIHK